MLNYLNTMSLPLLNTGANVWIIKNRGLSCEFY